MAVKDTNGMDTRVFRMLSPSAVKILVALERLSAGAETFAASASAVEELTGLSHPTVVYARQELIEKKIVETAHPAGYYRILVGARPVKKVNTSIPEGNMCVAPVVNNAPVVSARAKVRLGRKVPGVSGVKSFNGVSLESRREVVTQACKIIGAAPTGRFVQMAMRSLSGLLKDGFSPEDALDVVRFARAKYDGGDRFVKLLNLMYLWSVREFTGLLTAARTTPAGGRKFSVLGDDEAHAFSEDYQRRVRERGLS